MTDTQEIIEKASWTGGDGSEGEPSLNIPGILGDTLKTYGRGFWFFLPIILLFSILFEISGQLVSNFLWALWFDSSLYPNDIAAAALEILAGMFADALYSSLAQALVILPAVNLYRGEEMQPVAALMRAFTVLPILIFVSLLIACAVAIGFVALIVPGIIIALMLYVAVPVLIIENKGLGSISRSMELTRGHRMGLLGLAILTGIVGAAIGFFILMAIESVWPSASASSIGASIVTLQSSVILAASYSVAVPFAAISTTLAYLRIVEIKEGGQSEHLRTVFE